MKFFRRKPKPEPSPVARALAFLACQHGDEGPRLNQIQSHRDNICLCAALALSGLSASSTLIQQRSNRAGSESDLRERIVEHLAPLLGADPASVLIEWARIERLPDPHEVKVLP